MTSPLCTSRPHVAILLSLLLVACGEAEENVPTEEAAPLLGLYNLPISLNNQGSAPSDAVRIEISPEAYRVDGTQVLELTRGRAASREVVDHVLVPVRDRIRQGRARRAAAISIHTNVPYITLVETLNTLSAEGLSELHFAVRTPGEVESWMPVRSWRVVGEGDEIAWSSAAPAFSAFTDHWREVYDACRAGQHIDCDAPYTNVARDGTLAMELWTRAQGMKITFSQIPPAEGAEAPARAGGVALIEGVGRRQPAPPAEEEEPATRGAFNFLHQEAARDESAISNAVAPVCANESCRVEVVADATGASMRVLSMLGAAFPNGFSQPEVAFRIP